MRMDIGNFPELDYACEEAINTLCTNLSFCGSKQKRIMVTSSRAHEGKTFIAMQLMRALAKLGKKVVLVDADLRRSVLNTHYNLEVMRGYGDGLANYLAGMCEAEQIVYMTDIYNARIIPVGRTVSNSLALLSDGRFGQLMESLSQTYDVVIVDAPPVGIVIDAAEIAKCCTGILLVVQYKETHRKELLDVKAQVEQTGCPILGAVLNNVSFDSYSSKKYYNKYYYSHYASDYYKPTKRTRAMPIEPK